MPEPTCEELKKRLKELEKAESECGRLESALRESEEKFRMLAENLRDIVFFQDMKFNIVYASPSAEELFGYSIDELKRMKKAEFMSPESFEKAMELYTKYVAMAMEEPAFEVPLMEYEYVRKDGSTFTGEMKVKFIRDENGALIANTGIIRDITERKILEEQLQIRQRMDSLGNLVSGIAHDFNNLLTGIMGNIDKLDSESDNFSESQKRYLRNAMKSCDKSASLIAQFQSLSKGTLTDKTAVDVYEIADDVFRVLKETTDRLIEKRIDFKKGQFYVYADPTSLHQVFMNLGTNAVHAIKDQGPKKGDNISIKVEDFRASGRDSTGLRKGDYIHIMFADSGQGMTAEVQRRAFEPLFTTKEIGSHKGQGLGLAMVYNIVTRNHDGYIAIETKKRRGTTFHVYMPKAKAKAAAKPRETVKIDGGNESVLIIDDEEIVLEFATDMLTEYGYTVLAAEDGKMGLDVYKENRDSVDLILLDLTMPEMSGRMVFEKILEINPKIKVIISSGLSEEELRRGILSLAKGYIKKPYKLNQLIHTVRTVLDS